MQLILAYMWSSEEELRQICDALDREWAKPDCCVVLAYSAEELEEEEHMPQPGKARQTRLQSEAAAGHA